MSILFCGSQLKNYQFVIGYEISTNPKAERAYITLFSILTFHWIRNLFHYYFL